MTLQLGQGRFELMSQIRQVFSHLDDHRDPREIYVELADQVVGDPRAFEHQLAVGSVACVVRRVVLDDLLLLEFDEERLFDGEDLDDLPSGEILHRARPKCSRTSASP